MSYALRSYAGAMGGLAMLYVFMRPLTTGPLGALLGGAALLFGALAILAGSRRGPGALPTAALVFLLGALIWAIMLVLSWYLTSTTSGLRPTP